MIPLAPNNVMVIGLGGTGKYILTYLKQSLIHAANHAMVVNSPQSVLTQEYGNIIPECIRLLCIDSDNSAVNIDGVSLDYDEVTGTEFICIGRDYSWLRCLQDDLITNASRQRDRTLTHQNFPWLEADDANKLPKWGFCVNRQYERLCFLENERVRHSLQTKITDAIAEFNRRTGYRKTYFIVVGSLAGGTGSGIFQDVLAFLSNSIQSMRIPPVLVGISVLSNAFNKQITHHETDGNQLQSNSIGALRELQRFIVQRNQPFQVNEYTAFEIQPTSSLPCEAIFVIDGTRGGDNDADLTRIDLHLALYPAIADYLQTYCINYDIPINLPTVQYYNSRSDENIFSTFGTHTWLLPVEDIIDSFSIRLARKYVTHILEQAPSNYNPLDDVSDFLENSNKYYCQNTPHDEYFRGVTPNADKFNFLNKIQQVIIDFETLHFAPAMDLDWFKDFFLPDQFPMRLEPGIGLYNPLDQCILPVLGDYLGKYRGHLSGKPDGQQNEDLSGNVEHFSENYEYDTDTLHYVFRSLQEQLDWTCPQKEVHNVAFGIVNGVLGTNSDSEYDPTLQRNGRIYTWHSVMNIYVKICNQIFGGYRDKYGNYLPGVLENKIFLILNDVRQQSEQLDSIGKPLTGNSGRQMYNISYSLSSQPLDRALAFCTTLESKLKLTKKIINDQYEATFKIGGTYIGDIIYQEVDSQFQKYLSSLLFRKKELRKYLQSMQDWTDNQRIVILKRSTTNIIDDFIAITRGWQETIEKCRDTFDKRYQADLVIKMNDVSLRRQSHAAIATRTYLVPENSPQENKLYAQTLDTPIRIETVDQDQQQVITTNTTNFINSSYLEMVLNSTDLDTQAGTRRTGRDIQPMFDTVGEQTAVFRPEDIIRNASYWCQSVRQNSLSDILPKDPRYYASPISGFSEKLAIEIKDKSSDFIQLSIDSSLLDNLTEFVLVGDPSASGCSSFYHPNPNRDFGQHFRLTANHQTYGFSLASLPLYQLNTYRSFISRNGSSVHIHLGEKYAAKYEQMIISRWRELGLQSPPSDDFTLPLESINALQAVKNLKQFFWAGAYLNLLSREKSAPGINAYYLTFPEGLKVTLGSGGEKSIFDIILEYVHSNGLNTGQYCNIDMPSVRERVEKALEQITDNKNSDKEAFDKRLQQLFVKPLDLLITEPYNLEHSFVELIGAIRTNNPREMESLEKLELLFKCFVLEELL